MMIKKTHLTIGDTETPIKGKFAHVPGAQYVWFNDGGNFTLTQAIHNDQPCWLYKQNIRSQGDERLTESIIPLEEGQHLAEENKAVRWDDFMKNLGHTARKA